MPLTKFIIESRMQAIIGSLKKTDDVLDIVVLLENAMVALNSNSFDDMLELLHQSLNKGDTYIEKVDEWARGLAFLPFSDEARSIVYDLFNLVRDVEINKDDFIAASQQPSQNQIDKSHSAFDQKKVFIVHGRDDAMKLYVEGFLNRIGLTPIILSDKANAGETVFQKLLDNVDVGYAIILYSGCDLGKLRTDLDDQLKPRARQNVVFEHGLMVGKLGKNRVMTLIKGDVDIPSDINGIAYIAFDDNGGWKLKIITELREAHYDVNL